MDSIWAPVVAALGASILTTAGLLLRDRVGGGKKRLAERLAAYEDLLVQSMVVIHSATSLRSVMELRSGLIEGLELAFGNRRPIDPLDFADRLRGDFQPLFAAWTSVWARGSQESIPIANELVGRCRTLLDVATERGMSGGFWGRLIRGERWTRGQETAFTEALGDVGESRKRLANLLRHEGGEKPVELLLPQRPVSELN